VLQCVAIARADQKRNKSARMWCGLSDCSVVRSGAVWCSVLQCVAVCCSVLQCVAVWRLHMRIRNGRHLRVCDVACVIAVYGSVLQCVTVCCSVVIACANQKQ